jgi:OCT family organic cation transporter-like MFS transporter 4/5
MNTIIENLNPYGRYQKFMLFIIGIPSALSAITIYSTIFTAAEPGFFCENNDNTLSLKNNSEELCKIWSNTSIDYNCYFEDEYYGDTIISDLVLICDRKFLASLTQTFYFTGQFSGLFAGYFGDKYGRKRASFILMCLLSVTMILTQILLLDVVKLNITGKYVIYSIEQFLIGAFVNSLYSSAYVLLLESTTSIYNTLFSNIMLTYYVLGELIILLLAYFIRDWQIINLIIAGLTTISTIVFYFLADESPKWYFEQKKYPEAIIVIKKIARINKKSFDETQFENEKKIYDEESSNKMFNNKVSPIENMKIEESNEGISMKTVLIEIFTPRKVLFKTLLIVYIWFASILLYFGISLGISGIDSVNPYVLYIFQSLAEVAGYWLCLLNDKFGKRRMNIIYLILSASVCLIVSLVPRNKDFDDEAKVLQDAVLIISLISIGKFTVSASFNTLFVYTTELYDTRVRNFALVMCSCVGRLGSLISPQINFLGTIVWKTLPFLIFSISAFIAAVFNFILPEKSF